MQIQSSESKNPFQETKNCLFSDLDVQKKSVWKFEGEFSPAIRPLPPARTKLTQALASAKTFQAFTPWSRVGNPKNALSVVTFTPLPSPGEHDLLGVWVLKDQLHVKSTASDFQPQYFKEDEKLLLFLQDYFTKQDYKTLLLIADGSLPMTRVIEISKLFSRLHNVSITLGVTIRKDVLLPKPSPQADASESLFCSDGLPPLAQAENMGNLSIPQIKKVFNDDILQSLGNCLNLTRFEKNGGKLKAFTRVNPKGQITKMCIAESDFSETVLHECIVDNFQHTQFPKPNPAGFVDLLLPFSLEPLSEIYFSPICEK